MKSSVAVLFLAIATLAAARPPLQVVALSPVLSEITRQVGGPEVEVHDLIPAGVDPHDFEPAPSDAAVLAQADLIIASGFGLDNYLDRFAAGAGSRAPILRASSALAAMAVTTEIGGRPEPDPHWWNSVIATARVTEWLAHELAQRRPEATGRIRARAGAYGRLLTVLDQWTRTEISLVPPARRRLVTVHDAFRWFARDYGFEVASISGANPEAEPNARDFAALVDRVRRERVPAVFVEYSSNPQLAQALCRETGARLGGTLYADGLSNGGEGATYPGMFRHNVRTIVEALR